MKNQKSKKRRNLKKVVTRRCDAHSFQILFKHFPQFDSLKQTRLFRNEMCCGESGLGAKRKKKIKNQKKPIIFTLSFVVKRKRA